jgi:hypothetical protein
MPDWRRQLFYAHLFYRTECVRTTWKLRISALILIILFCVFTRNLWVAHIGQSLVCGRDVASSEVLLIENFDPTFVLFERAEELQRAGLAQQVLVPIQALREPGIPNLVSKDFADVMARHARIPAWDTVPIVEIEPITLNAAFQLRDRLIQQQVKSVTVVTSAFRSRRSALVYGTVFGRAGILVRCEPVNGPGLVEHWTASWHEIQTVVEEFLKLQYYRFYVIPFLSRSAGQGESRGGR